MIDPITGKNTDSTSGAPKTVATGMSGMGRDAFLQLLVTQLGHQNPLQPQADGEFIAQLAQFSSLEQLTQIQSTLASMAKVMGAVVPVEPAKTGSTSGQVKV